MTIANTTHEHTSKIRKWYINTSFGRLTSSKISLERISECLALRGLETDGDLEDTAKRLADHLNGVVPYEHRNQQCERCGAYLDSRDPICEFCKVVDDIPKHMPRRLRSIDLGPEPQLTRQWFAEGAIEDDNSIILLSGAEKRGKSWMLADLAIATITGSKWLGQFTIKKPGPVVIFDAEYRKVGYRRRLARLARGRGLDFDQLRSSIEYVESNRDLLRLATNTNQARNSFDDLIYDLTIHAIEPSLIIIDPLRNHLSDDENLAMSALEAFDVIDNLRTIGNCPVAIAHHLNKSGDISGSRALSGRPDILITGSDTDTQRFTVRGRTIRSCDAIADGFSVKLDFDDRDDEHEDETTTVVTAILNSETKSKLDQSGTKAIDEKVLKLLSVNPLRKTTIKSTLRCSNTTVSSSLSRLRELNLIQYDPALNMWTIISK